jgi:hypothetical protein
MADDFWSRKRKEEEEEERRAQEDREREEALQKRRRSQFGGSGPPPVEGEAPAGPESGRLDSLILQAGPLIEVVNQLYIRYGTGEQARPPLEQRQRLDTMIILMQNLAKHSAADRFRFSTINQSYTTHRSRWEKLIQDIETGKIRRVVKNRG